MPRILQSFCIGHIPPLFRTPIDFHMLCPASLGMDNEIVIDDNRFGNNIDGGSLAEYSQLFALAEMLSAGDLVADDLFLFQYRKFISPNQGGVPSTASWVRIATAGESESLFPSAGQLDALASRVVVGSLLNLSESIPSSYAKMHVIDDFVMFAAACAKNKYLSEEDIKGFSTLQGMIPSPALCYTNAALFVAIMEILKETWDCYYKSYQIKRTGYQRRVAGYLMERLHSYLLCKWLMDGSEPDIRLWQRYVVSA
jgi:hypothetical protein